MDIERNLLAAMLAVRNGMVSLEEVQALFPRWRDEAQGEFLDWLSRQGKLAKTDLTHLQRLLDSKLAEHDGDAQAGLNSLTPKEDWQSLTSIQATLTGDTARLVLPPAVTPIAIPGRPISKPPAPAADHKRRYVRLRLHAAGGIGQVFLARDTHLDRDVALKELKPDATRDPSMGWRFLKEAHITGQLEHPGIVPVYELVTDEEGEGSVPYYVMRFLRGRTLSQAIQEYHQKRRTEEASLERVALLNVFNTVCQTVAFAHSRGIIHRDLKGANILLGDFGEVAVLDWGLAKKLNSEESTNLRDKVKSKLDLDGSAEFEQTLPGQVLGTPYYMSPEQAAGQPVDVRSDVYSLGAILYEILAELPPFAQPGNKNLSIRELLHRISVEEPVPPREIVPETPPALEAICLRAMAKVPAERYAGAAELGQEVQRWLADEPVHAYREPFMARLGRWGRRNRVLVTSAGVLLLASVIGLSIFTLLLNQEQDRTEKALTKANDANEQLTLEQGRTEKARADAVSKNEQLILEKKRTEEARADSYKKSKAAIDAFLTNMSEEQLRNEPGAQRLRRELLDKAHDFYIALAHEKEDDPVRQLDLGEAKLKLAMAHSIGGDRGQSIKIYEEARTLFRRLLAGNPDADVYRCNLAECERGLGTQFLLLEGPSQKSEDLLGKARADLAELVQQKPLPRYRDALAEAHNSLAFFLNRQRATVQGPEADALKRRATAEQEAAVNLWQKLVDDYPDNAEYAGQLSGGLGNMATLYDLNVVKEKLTQAVGLLEPLVKKFPRSINYQKRVAGAYRNLGLIHNLQGSLVEAEDFFRRAVKVRTKLARLNPLVVELQAGAAFDYHMLGQVLYQRGSSSKGEARHKLLAEAKEAYVRTNAIYEQLTEDHPDIKDYFADWGLCLNCMGNVVYEESKIEAIPWYSKGIDRLESAFRAGQKRTNDHARSLASSYEGRGDGRVDQGNLQAALADLDRGVELRTGELRGQLILKRRQVRFSFAAQLMNKGDFESAAREIAKLAEEALAPRQTFLLAESLASCAALAHKAKSPLADKYAGEVVVLLRQAQAGGFFSNAGSIKGVEKLGAQAPPLQMRPDFQELLRELKKK